MSESTIHLFSGDNWVGLLTDATGITETLDSSSSYTVKDAEGVSLQILGANFSTQNFLGASVLAGGTITGFKLTLNGQQIAAGSGFDLSAGALYDAIVRYVMYGHKSSIVDLFFGSARHIKCDGNIADENLGRFAHYHNIRTIDGTKGHAHVTAGTFQHDKKVLNKIAGGFAIYDRATNVAKSFGALKADGAKVDSIHLTGSGVHTLDLTAARAAHGAGLLHKIAGSYVVNIAYAHDTTTHGHGAGLLIQDVKGHDTIVGGGAKETFVFGRDFGHASLVDFHNHASGAGHDYVSLLKAEFASFAAVLHDAKQVGANVEITAANGDQITLDHMNLAAVQGAAADFKFV